jgi:hypothetical protein
MNSISQIVLKSFTSKKSFFGMGGKVLEMVVQGLEMVVQGLEMMARVSEMVILSSEMVVRVSEKVVRVSEMMVRVLEMMVRSSEMHFQKLVSNGKYFEIPYKNQVVNQIT